MSTAIFDDLIDTKKKKRRRKRNMSIDRSNDRPNELLSYKTCEDELSVYLHLSVFFSPCHSPKAWTTEGIVCQVNLSYIWASKVIIEYHDVSKIFGRRPSKIKSNNDKHEFRCTDNQEPEEEKDHSTLNTDLITPSKHFSTHICHVICLFICAFSREMHESYVHAWAQSQVCHSFCLMETKENQTIKVLF